MKLLGFNFDKISIEKKKKLERPVNINSNVEIKDIKKAELDLLGKKDTLLFDYEFTVDYNHDAVKLIIQGNVLILFNEESEDIKKILQDWKKKELSKEINISLLNLVFSKCNLKALQLEEDLNIPPHLPNPVFSPKDKKENNKN